MRNNYYLRRYFSILKNTLNQANPNLLALFLISIMSFYTPVIAQSSLKITGKVIDQSNVAVIGATIIEVGTDKGVVTDIDGNFTMNVLSNSQIQVSYVGYETQTISVNGQTNFAITLEESKRVLDELVIIGYGTVRKSDLTGAVASIKADDVRSSQSTTIDQALQGKAAGVDITQMSGKPGAETSIRIRGTSSINAGNEPLYVVDGILINSDGGDISVGGTRGPRLSPLSSLNPNDIESIEILKDASSTAMYGSRGTNGVILITTKRGKLGKPLVSLDVIYGTQRVTRKLDLLNASQFANLVNEARINAKQTPIYVNPKNLGAGTDWQDEILRSAPVGNYQLNVAGGAEKVKYSLTGSFFDQKGIIINTDFKRYSFRSNIDVDITDKLSIGNSLSYSITNSSGVLTNAGQIVPGVISAALLFNPVLPVYDDAVRGGYTFENNRGKTLGNPYAEAVEYNSITKLTRTLGNIYLKYKIIPSLELKTSFSIDQFNNDESSYGPSFLKRSQGSNGEAVLGKTNGMTWLSENTINYNNEFGENHRIDAVAGFTMQEFKNEKLFVYAFDFPDDRTGYHNIGTALKPQKPSNSESQWNMISYLGRVNYTFLNKYLFTLTGRVDGSSKFSQGQKYGFFPSAATAWRLSQENFLKDVSILDDWKIRMSYGVLGNQAIPPYSSLALIGPFGEGSFNSSAGGEIYTGQEPQSYVNRNLKWETTRQLDLGMDLLMFNSRIGLTLDYYKKKTFDLLLSTPIPLTSGFNSTLLNVGNIDNHGFELNLRTDNIRSAFEWSSDFNISTNKNKISNLNSDTDIILVGALLLRENESIGTFYGYNFQGIFQTDEEAKNSPVLSGQEPNSSNPASRAKAGDRKYEDINGDGKIDENDRVILGKASPKFTYGFTNNFKYKNIELNVFLQGAYGNKLANFNNYDLLNFTGHNNVLAEAALDRWTPDNKGNKYPRALGAGSVDQGIFSSAIVEDASYIRLKNVTLSYHLPSSAISALNMSSLRLFATATNLFTITDYTGYDPEANTYGQSTTLVGIDSGGYPQSKSFQFGFSLTF